MSEKSQGYYIYNDNVNDLILVFVHGFLSDSEKCWTCQNSGVFWPDLIQKDSRFKKTSIYLSEYNTSLNSNDYSVQNCAEEVFGQLKRDDGSANPPPLENKNIVFVTHSAGGIVVRYLLEVHRDFFRGKKIGLALYASPSYGSKLASILGWVAKLGNHKFAKELSWASPILDDLDGRFRDLLDKKKLNIFGFEAFENKPPFRTFIFQNSNARIVEKESASRYFGKPTLIPDSSHSSIVKPNKVNHPSHNRLFDFLDKKGFFNVDLKSNDLSIFEKNRNNGEQQANVLFGSYKPVHDVFFVAREDYKDIFKSLDRLNIWVCGSSGIGKTVAIQRAIYKKGFQPKYVSLGTCIDAPIDILFNDIFVSLTDSPLSENTPIRTIIKKISEQVIKRCNTEDLCLFIEEIPIKTKQEFITFSQYIYALLMLLKDVQNFRLVLSSIFEPDDVSGTELEKISESFKLIRSKKWSDDDIHVLIGMIEAELKVENSMLDGSSSFNGSPREVKQHYRNVKASSIK